MTDIRKSSTYEKLTILRRPAKFRRNQTIAGGVITSYRFFKMAAMESKIYFRVQVLQWHSFKG